MLPALTEREIQVLRLIAHGLSNRQIASMLFISESTVENHVHHIFLKLGISNRTQAVVHALKAKIVHVTDVLENRGNPS